MSKLVLIMSALGLCGVNISINFFSLCGKSSYKGVGSKAHQKNNVKHSVFSNFKGNSEVSQPLNYTI